MPANPKIFSRWPFIEKGWLLLLYSVVSLNNAGLFLLTSFNFLLLSLKLPFGKPYACVAPERQYIEYRVRAHDLDSSMGSNCDCII